MRKFLFVLVCVLAIGSKAHANTLCTTNTIPANPTQNQVQTALNGCAAGTYLQGYAGTTSVSGSINIPCGVMLIGPTATPATMVFDGGGNIGFIFTQTNSCTSGSSTGISYIKTQNGGGLYMDGTNKSNITLTHSQITNIPDAETPCTRACQGVYVSGSITNGSSNVSVSSTSGLYTGMCSGTSGMNGCISSVNSGSVTMSSNSSSSSSKTLHFYSDGNGSTNTTFSLQAGMGYPNTLTNTLIEYNSFSDTNSCTNTISRNYVSSFDDGSGGPDGCGIEMGGQGSNPNYMVQVNTTIRYNTFTHVDEGIHFYGSNYTTGTLPINYANGFDIEYNWFQSVRRITIEWQAQTVTNPLVISNNVFGPTGGFGTFNSYLISTPCCQFGTESNSSGAANPAYYEQNNVMFSSLTNSCSSAGCNGYQWCVEYWGNNSAANYNLCQGLGCTGYQIGYNGNNGGPYAQYNTIQGPIMAGSANCLTYGNGPGKYITPEFNGQYYGGAQSPNNESGTTTSFASVAPTISPGSSAQTFPLTVTLTDAGYTSSSNYIPHGNTGIWVTTDGSNPVPGSNGNYVASGGTITMNAAGTVKAVGMWGTPNEPTSYPANEGFTPSSVVSATYSGASGPPTLTGVTLTLQDGTSTVQVGNSKQACANMSYNNGISNTECGNTADQYGTAPNSWTSSVPGNASITNTGSVAGVAAGSTNLTVHAGSFVSPNFGLAVTAAAATLQSTTTTCPSSVAVGQTGTCSLACNYSGPSSSPCPSASWSSGNTSVATVNATSGVAMGVAVGSTSILGTYGGFQSSAPISVTSSTPPPATLSSVSASCSPGSVIVGNSISCTATCTYSDSSTTNCTTQDAHSNTATPWASSATSIATINSTSGIARGVAVGTTNITVGASGVSTSAPVSLAVVAAPSTTALGQNQYDYASVTYANYINATYAVTGSASTVSTCTFYLPTGYTYTSGSLWDCGMVLAPTPTTQSYSWLCHATYTTLGTSADVGWHALPLSGCGTLSGGQGYWIAVDTNEAGPIGEGAYDCGTYSGGSGSCTGAAPTGSTGGNGAGSYPYYYISAPYGTYTGMGTAMSVNGAALQSSQYVTLTSPTPALVSGYLTTPGSTSTLQVNKTLQVYAVACYSNGSCYLASPNATPFGDSLISISSSNTSVMTVGQVGTSSAAVVYGVAPGTANVTGVLTGGKSTAPYGFTVSSTPQALPPASPRALTK